MGFFANFLKSNSRNDEFIQLCSYGSAEDVKNAVALGKSANAKDSYGKTALMYAAENNNDDKVLSILIDAGANVNIAYHEHYFMTTCYKYNTTALHVVASAAFDNSRNIKVLARAGADIEAVMHYYEAWDMVRDAFFNYHYSFNVLVLAIASGNTENVRAVIEAGADVNRIKAYYSELVFPESKERLSNNVILRSSSLYPLSAAVCHTVDTNTKIIELLLETGADINARDINGRTALCYAMGFVPGFSGNPEAAKLLEERGAVL